MQAPGPMQRQIHRRSPGAEPGQPPPPNAGLPARAMSPALSRPSTRSLGGGSSGSAAGGGGGGGAPGARRANTSSGSTGSAVPLSQIEKSVTHLLVATKQLLETLTQWSRGQATDTQVSDVYVRLGYEFNMACRAFSAINIDTSDLGNVPELLRNILEATLSQEASSESLEKYLPRIRDIIINLLQGLKRKQHKLRQRQARERDAGGPASSAESAAAAGAAGVSGRASSLSTSASAGSGLTSLLNESIENGYGDIRSSEQPPAPPPQQQQPLLPQPGASPSRRYGPSRDRTAAASASDPSASSSTQDFASSFSSRSAGGAYADGSSSNGVPPSGAPAQAPGQQELNIDAFPPPPPPKSVAAAQQSALMALQRGDHLERRASRRYSQYQIQKHLGSSFANGVPLLPPQTTPIPNRGRGEVRESMRAVQGRNGVGAGAGAGAGGAGRGSGYEPSPSPSPMRGQQRGDDLRRTATADDAGSSSPMAATPEDKYPQPSATLNGPPPPDLMPALSMFNGGGGGGAAAAASSLSSSSRPRGDSSASTAGRTEEERKKSLNATQAALVGEAYVEASAAAAAAAPPTAPPVPVSTAAPTASSSAAAAAADPAGSKELTLFLQYKSKVKKFVLAEGYSELTIGRLQLAFIEKFSWNTQQNGADLPEIYIQDPVSGVRHELEDLADIKDRTVLALNVEPLDEVKRHIDEGLGSLKSMVQQVKQNVDEQGAALQRVSDRQQEAAKDMARLATAPPSAPVGGGTAAVAAGAPTAAAGASAAAGTPQPMTPPADSPRATSMSGGGAGGGPRKRAANHVVEVQSLRRDLAVLRQTYASFQSDVASAMTALRNKAASVKQAVAATAIPDVEGGGGQALVAAGRKKLSAESDRLVTKVDDLQDLVEDLRKDVVHRGVRPLPRQLEAVTKDITQLTKDLKRMEETMRRDKPVWTKIWERELEEVCKGRDELQLAEDLLVDLQDDLEKASETFALVEQATKEQMKDAGAGGGGAGGGGGGGGVLPGIGIGLRPVVVDAADPSAAKEGVLGEVRALQPNHADRLEAIERAEKLRQKELASRRVNPLMQELSDFVEEGRLKKSGGFEEAERARKAKDDRIRREVWERMNGVVLDDGGGGEEDEGGQDGQDGQPGPDDQEAHGGEGGQGGQGGQPGEAEGAPAEAAQ